MTVIHRSVGWPISIRNKSKCGPLPVRDFFTPILFVIFWSETVPTSERTRPDFQPGKEVLGAAKTVVLGTVAIWGIFLAIQFIGGADGDAFWGAFALFGVLGPVFTVFLLRRQGRVIHLYS
jgi:hypothetical protein